MSDQGILMDPSEAIWSAHSSQWSDILICARMTVVGKKKYNITRLENAEVWEQPGRKMAEKLWIWARYLQYQEWYCIWYQGTDRRSGAGRGGPERTARNIVPDTTSVREPLIWVRLRKDRSFADRSRQGLMSNGGKESEGNQENIDVARGFREARLDRTSSPDSRRSISCWQREGSNLGDAVVPASAWVLPATSGMSNRGGCATVGDAHGRDLEGHRNDPQFVAVFGTATSRRRATNQHHRRMKIQAWCSITPKKVWFLGS
ncbi:hypothetical protein B0H16DRAFT_1478756 [Mycena metata]|uniref:Uncharacterized protein n=1 Tax=Mycena metata TaxID=1033252 RepID=A0AAD7H611_9AGAR|nr:hypothetical protein B0H16DRAFT_1478756 [Mycena metata]